MERTKPSLQALTLEQQAEVRRLSDKESAAAVAKRWGITRFALGQAAQGYKVTAGTRSLVERGLESEAK